MPQSLYRSFTAREGGGRALEMPFAALARDRIAIRRGAVSMVAAASGGGKTAFITNYIAQTPSQTYLYLSPDTGETTLGTRLVATSTKSNALDLLDAYDDDNRRQSVVDMAKDVKNVLFCFDSSPTFTDIDEEIAAFVELRGDLPDAIVLDNVRDAVPESGEPIDFNRHTEVVDHFHRLARKLDIACILLAHLKGEHNNSNKSPGQDALRGQIGPNARLLLNVWQPGPDVMGVNPVKNSAGRSDASGDWTIDLQWDKENQWIGG